VSKAGKAGCRELKKGDTEKEDRTEGGRRHPEGRRTPRGVLGDQGDGEVKEKANPGGLKGHKPIWRLRQKLLRGLARAREPRNTGHIPRVYENKTVEKEEGESGKKANKHLRGGRHTQRRVEGTWVYRTMQGEVPSPYDKAEKPDKVKILADVRLKKQNVDRERQHHRLGRKQL